MAQPWQAEIDVDARLAERLIAQQFPEFATARIELLGAGWDNSAFLINGEFVFRFRRRKFALPFFQHECRILPAIADRLPLPIPYPEWIGVASDEFPWPFAGYRFLPGTTACIARLTDRERASLATSLGEFLRVLHALPVDEMRGLGAPGDDLGRLDLCRRLQQTEKSLATATQEGWLPKDPSFERILADARALPEPLAEPVLVHGDLYARHLLIGEQRQLCGVIDWGDVHLNDPAADLMIAHRFLPSAAHDDFFAAYGPVEQATWRRARFRALNHALLVLEFGCSTGETALQLAAETSLHYLSVG